jgi:uncharacterized membrane protein YdjX (TVP38/TMEM64 family)
MPKLARLLLLLALALAVPIVPFLLYGVESESYVRSWFEPGLPPSTVVLAVVLALASDVLLPIPSSVVSTFAGAQLGIFTATVASWFGMTAGAMLGYGLARWLGRPVAERLSSASDLDQLEGVAHRFSTSVLVVARPVPVFAEASVVLAGILHLPLRQFLPAVASSNLAISIVYASFGHLAGQQAWLPLALACSVAVPLLLMLAARRCLSNV